MDNIQLNKSNCIFLLGGHDLEMLEIKNLLIEHDYIFIDKNLAWGAKLSDYEDDISSNLINVCVELAEDITPPSKYLRIDHHNELATELSSIEQIANKIGVKLNRKQELIAANDKGHIAEMRKICATDDEINEIRKLDRAAQGVTPEMEEQAQKELENRENIEVFKTLAIFRTSLPKFSPISDKLCLKYQNYLIYNLSPNEVTFTFYGKGANSDLPTLFAKEVNDKTAYFGGIGNGYFGVNKNSFTADEMLLMIDKIKDYHAE